LALHVDTLGSEVHQAATIQLSLLPNSPPCISGYEIAGGSQPAEVVGGEFFGFSILNEVFSLSP
jgi:serine phosphatase RsbU (regulator of sigma subunit)